MDHFELVSDFAPTGDQPQAIEELVKGFKEGNQFETLLGVTGSGKTFTMANVIAQLNKPTLILAHNKTLAAQLYSEFKAFFPHNAVEYFVSYYDYYQPEAYVPSTDTYIEKDSSINDAIDKLRHSATAALIERKDVIVVSSVSCVSVIWSSKSTSETRLSVWTSVSVSASFAFFLNAFPPNTATITKAAATPAIIPFPCGFFNGAPHSIQYLEPGSISAPQR